ncbi:cyclin domain-containing protein [Hesseltinella vesiculosa]|uniref:Cyclin domain-containing protein n=1 Tax=Hesseltinella vesiculosa TaxID=101127 RepID=A0A1X2G215_9FUNG|nr:cyclin domain-containing protein [Hesseltinella vesiculosa]
MLKKPKALLSFTTNTATSILPCSNKKSTHIDRLPPLQEFIDNVVQKSQLPPCVCLVSLIYLQRLKTKLPPHARGDGDTPYRLFLAAILTASKFLSETGTALTCQSITEVTNFVYSPKDINHMERSFLGLIKYDLYVDVQGIRDYLALHGNLLEMDLIEAAMEP